MLITEVTTKPEDEEENSEETAAERRSTLQDKARARIRDSISRDPKKWDGENCRVYRSEVDIISPRKLNESIRVKKTAIDREQDFTIKRLYAEKNTVIKGLTEMRQLKVTKKTREITDMPAEARINYVDPRKADRSRMIRQRIESEFLSKKTSEETKKTI